MPNDNSNNSSGDKNPADENKAKDEAAVAALINKVTGEAVSQKVGYDWKRDCKVRDINVGRLTSALNGIIKGIDENADLNSVVGGFLGNGSKQETIKKGTTLAEMKDSEGKGYYHGTSYTLKATSLKASDIKNLKISGDKYIFELPDSQNPDRNGNTPLSRFTNDIVIRDEVEAEIKGFTNAVSIPSLTAKYSKIKASVTIKDNKLVELKYTYRADAELDVKLGFTITGTGNLSTTATYSNFQY